MTNILFLTLCLTITLISTTTALSQNEPSSDEKLSAHWLLKLDTDDLELAKSIAREHNFNVVRQVGRIEGYYMVESTHNGSRAKRDLADHHAAVQASAQRIVAHPSVEMFAREKLLSRKKRDYVEDETSEVSYMNPFEPQLSEVRATRLGEGMGGVDRGRGRLAAAIARRLERANMLANPNQDPFWDQMWYMNRNMRDPMMPDMNVTAAWAMGYSGRGVSVTFLDDGLEWNHPDLLQNYDPKVIHFILFSYYVFYIRLSEIHYSFHLLLNV
jgi:hypothetical protein